MQEKLQLASIKNTCMNSQIYEPSDDSFALIDAIVQDQNLLKRVAPKIVVELGSGSGYITCSLKLVFNYLNVFCQCWTTDISSQAINATNITLKQHNILNEIECIQMDLFSNFMCNKQIDILVFNPPYVPTPEEELLREDVGRAWAGGYKGRQVMDKVLNKLDTILSSQGIMYLVTVHDNEPEQIIDDINSNGLFVGEIALERAADEERLYILRIMRIQVKQLLEDL
eukprot:TRINITY_DN9644_c0_g1_i1.p1 TRINITY_DN9644_c0_g1~~TRINITY_DN9644_c0_g1_i1.p1  ORF type:complete len:227 (+),score=29.80 TRINITY_DN9644_c0_g1_i1:227-907(+)